VPTDTAYGDPLVAPPSPGILREPFRQSFAFDPYGPAAKAGERIMPAPRISEGIYRGIIGAFFVVIIGGGGWEINRISAGVESLGTKLDTNLAAVTDKFDRKVDQVTTQMHSDNTALTRANGELSAQIAAANGRIDVVASKIDWGNHWLEIIANKKR
jgi:hypothetical protein